MTGWKAWALAGGLLVLILAVLFGTSLLSIEVELPPTAATRG